MRSMPGTAGAGSLIQADRIVGAVIQLGHARRFVVRDLLGMFNDTTILQVGGNAKERVGSGRLESVPIFVGTLFEYWCVCSIIGLCLRQF
jgi:hypothetical protein